MELADGGDLALKVGCDPLPSLAGIKKWLLQCLSALNYMHTVKRIWHRDIKPENILLTSAGDIKIADFGLACVEKSSLSKYSFAGTLTYASYEKGHGLRYDSKDDIWALGCVFVELLTGKRLSGNLYETANAEVANRKKKVIDSCSNAGQHEPALVASIIISLQHNPSERPSAQQWLHLITPTPGNFSRLGTL
jgi:serine/threonine protein kinase